MADVSPDPAPDPAKARFFMLLLMRLGGLVMSLAGILIVGEAITAPTLLGIGLLIVGLFEFFILPVMLAKRWKSPAE